MLRAGKPIRLPTSRSRDPTDLIDLGQQAKPVETATRARDGKIRVRAEPALAATTSEVAVKAMPIRSRSSHRVKLSSYLTTWPRISPSGNFSVWIFTYHFPAPSSAA